MTFAIWVLGETWNIEVFFVISKERGYVGIFIPEWCRAMFITSYTVYGMAEIVWRDKEPGYV